MDRNSQAPDDSGAAAVLDRWFAAFNARDLAAMLSCTAADVRIYPLTLDGVQNSYLGHRGLQRWIDTLDIEDHRHVVRIFEILEQDRGEALAVGELRFFESGDPHPFWARHLVEDDLVTIVHHNLGEPELDEPLPPLLLGG